MPPGLAQGRILKTQLRLGALPLMIHTLRQEKVDGMVIERSERKCMCCDMNTCEDELHFLGECPAYREQRMQFILEVKDRLRKYEIKMQGKPLENIVINQWTQEKDSRDNLTGIYRLLIAVMKDEESVDIPKGLFHKIAHLFYSYLNECWIRRLKLLKNDDLVVQAMRSAYDDSNIASGESETKIAAGVIYRSKSASKIKDDEAARKKLKIEKNSFYIGTWIL